jgi:alpha/beta superfamily hydrolase
MPAHTELITFQGAAGAIDTAIDWPDSTPRGYALVLHPHSLHGGARDNKVVTTISRACLSEGLVTIRPDFRGVGKSEGAFDKARGETADMVALIAQFRAQYPDLASLQWILAGFSFGTAVAAQTYAELADATDGEPLPSAVILAGAAVGRFQYRDVSLPADSLLIHGEVDEVVPLEETRVWAAARKLPITVIPNASHFFHGKLVELKTLVLERLQAVLR